MVRVRTRSRDCSYCTRPLASLPSAGSPSSVHRTAASPSKVILWALLVFPWREVFIQLWFSSGLTHCVTEASLSTPITAWEHSLICSKKMARETRLRSKGRFDTIQRSRPQRTGLTRACKWPRPHLADLAMDQGQFQNGRTRRHRGIISPGLMLQHEGQSKGRESEFCCRRRGLRARRSWSLCRIGCHRSI